jgi:glucose-6-phosphate isomerase
MNPIFFSYDNNLIPSEELAHTAEKLLEEIKRMNNAVALQYEDDRASINLPDDKQALKKIKMLVEEKKELKPSYLIVVGIGGSNLGTMAVQEAILGKLYNQLNPNIKVLYADTVDSDLIDDIIKIIEPILKKGENVIINGVSKSGGTTETIANFEILVELLKKYKKDYEKYVVVTSDKNSKFWNFALENRFDVLEIPKKVGGRYSVFSPVGLFPLGIIGIKIDQLLEGAHGMKSKCLSDNLLENPAVVSATLIYLHRKKGKNIHDLFLFGTDLESVGKWYRQLMGESIGKEFNKGKKRVFEGITPTVSIGSVDLHSMAQMYLGGPYDKFTTFINVKQNNSDMIVPDISEYSKLVEVIQGRRLKELMDAIMEGVKTAFKKGKRPFTEIILQDKSEYSIGQLLQFKMMEMMYLGFLLEVNPFDQPNVEDYKVETRKILESKKIVSSL